MELRIGGVRKASSIVKTFCQYCKSFNYIQNFRQRYNPSISANSRALYPKTLAHIKDDSAPTCSRLVYSWYYIQVTGENVKSSILNNKFLIFGVAFGIKDRQGVRKASAGAKAGGADGS